MCEPTLIIMAIGALWQGQQEKRMHRANEKIQNIQAEHAIARGEAEEAALRRQVSTIMGRQQSQFSASGVETTTGSASDIMADTAMLGELDALTVRNNAEMEAFALRSGASISSAQSSAATTSSLLTAAGYAAKGWGASSSNQSTIN